MPWPPPSRMLCVWPQPPNSYCTFDGDVELEFYRANGECACEVCGFEYNDHPIPPQFRESCPTLVVLCRGEVVKT